jgi:hypothetical protein
MLPELLYYSITVFDIPKSLSLDIPTLLAALGIELC